MFTLNANRDHPIELGDHTGENGERRTHFGQLCTATKYGICASLAKQYDMQDVSAYRHLADEMLENLSAD